MQCRVHLNDDARTDWYSTMEMLFGGTWQRAASGQAEGVTSPYDGAVTAEIISAEAGKTIAEATGEASRSGDLTRLAAFEGTQLYGDALALDANRGTGLDKLGFTVRQPAGIVTIAQVRHRQGGPLLGGGQDDRRQDRHPDGRPW